MGRMRLDDEKLEALRSWGERLQESGGEESAAVGRAILMLVEEIDRLHVDVWHARMKQAPRDYVPADQSPAAEEPAPNPSPDVDQAVTSSLQARLHRVLRRDPGSGTAERVEKPGPDTDSDSDSSSPQAWIAALRRQK
jgi:hypothetical protein